MVGSTRTVGGAVPGLVVVQYQDWWWCSTRTGGGAVPGLVVVQYQDWWWCSTRTGGGAVPRLVVMQYQGWWWCYTSVEAPCYVHTLSHTPELFTITITSTTFIHLTSFTSYVMIVCIYTHMAAKRCRNEELGRDIDAHIPYTHNNMK